MDRQGLPRKVLRWSFAFVAACASTLAVFLVLPVLQAISEGPDRDLVVRAVDVGRLPPPPPPPPPPEEEPEPEEPPPPPKWESTSEPMELAQLELALQPGLGDGAFGDFAVDVAKRLEDDDGGEAVSRIFSLSELDQRPRVLFQRPPRYPQELLRSGRGGTVHVLFEVDEQGRVSNAKVQRSTDPAFETPALEAVREWRFEPGTREGQPVGFRIRIPITFNAS